MNRFKLRIPIILYFYVKMFLNIKNSSILSRGVARGVAPPYDAVLLAGGWLCLVVGVAVLGGRGGCAGWYGGGCAWW